MKWLLCAGLIAAMQLPAPTTAHAQITHASQGRLDENATAALAKAAKYLQSVKGTVTLTMLDGNKKQVARQTAKVSYMKGKYSLVADNMEIVCNGTTIWQWNKDAKEIVINNMPPETEVNLMDPGRLMTYYPKNFRAKYIRTDDDGTAVIDLTPLSSQSYHKLRLLINEETGQLKQLEVHKYDSSREIYDFSKLKRAALPSTFGFKPEEHPECEVIDMR
ncbi:MAG: outer membrane lipoprotein carrier protein LolA [Bacteroidales bacterium]|nr:outer membrane lipoprotein carrier protein LolA [Bacteroidales bacterium]